MADRMVLRWNGMDELRKTLGTIPAAMTPEIQALVLYHARAAEGALRAGYHQGPTGNLRRGVRLGSVMQHGTMAAVLQSRAPHAWIYERGTKVRQGAGGNQIGKGSRKGNKLANRGASRAFNTFRDTVVPQGERLYQDLKALLTRRGFTVRDGPPNAA